MLVDSKKIDLKDFFEEKAFIISIFLLASMYTLRFSVLDTYKSFRILFMVMRLISYSLVAIKFLIDFYKKKYAGYELFIIIITLYMAYISYRSRTINYFVSELRKKLNNK